MLIVKNLKVNRNVNVILYLKFLNKLKGIVRNRLWHLQQFKYEIFIQTMTKSCVLQNMSKIKNTELEILTNV